MLHTVNKSPSNSCALDSCLRVIQPGSAILLIEDGVFAATEGSEASSHIKRAAGSCAVYALEPDIKARGLAGRMMEEVQIIDFDGFVELSEHYPKTQSWY